MANPSKSVSQLADPTDKPLIGSQQTKIADLVITYGTDDPNVTVNNAIAVNDGDLFPAAEGLIALEEIVAKINAIIDVLEAHGLSADA